MLALCVLCTVHVCTVSVQLCTEYVSMACVYTRHSGVCGLGTAMCICPPTHAHTYICVIV